MSPTGSIRARRPERDYRVALTKDGAVDRARTALLRQAQAAE